jgi:tetratricopeptide (TPR) repeat protein
MIEARDALLDAGDDATAAEAEMLLSALLWSEGRRELADEHAGRAAVLVAGAPAGKSSVWVTTRQASLAVMAGDDARGLELATKALGLASELGWEQGISAARELIGMARVYMGDRGGLDEIERAIEMALAAGVLGTLSRSYNSLSVAHQALGDLRAGYGARLEAARLAEQIGSPNETRWFRTTLTDFRYRLGDWDEALPAIDRQISEIEAGSPHYSAFQLYGLRAEIRLARGDLAGARGDAEASLAAGRALEPQALYFALPVAAHVFSHSAADDRAVPLAREHIDDLGRGVSMQFAMVNLPLLGQAARRLGLAGELDDALENQPGASWTEAIRAYSRGEFAAAAEVLADIGTKPHEADARLRAAEQLVAEGRRAEADEQLHAALAFYRSVGAAHYVRDCEALLAESA